MQGFRLIEALIQMSYQLNRSWEAGFTGQDWLFDEGKCFPVMNLNKWYRQNTDTRQSTYCIGNLSSPVTYYISPVSKSWIQDKQHSCPVLLHAWLGQALSPSTLYHLALAPSFCIQCWESHYCILIKGVDFGATYPHLSHKLPPAASYLSKQANFSEPQFFSYNEIIVLLWDYWDDSCEIFRIFPPHTGSIQYVFVIFTDLHLYHIGYETAFIWSTSVETIGYNICYNICENHTLGAFIGPHQKFSREWTSHIPPTATIYTSVTSFPGHITIKVSSLAQYVTIMTLLEKFRSLTKWSLGMKSH